MKRNTTAILVLIACLLGCDHESITPKSGNIQFTFSDTSPGGKTKETTTPAFVLITINNVSGNPVVSDKVLSLYEFGSGYLSEGIQLPVGSYKLQKFVVLDADKKAIYATPLQNSELAKYVDFPLPISFEITENGNTLVTPQVMKIEADMNPDLFGLVNFSFEIREPIARVKKVTVSEGSSYTTVMNYEYIDGVLTQITIKGCNTNTQYCTYFAKITFEYYEDGQLKRRSYINDNNVIQFYYENQFENGLLKERYYFTQDNSGWNAEFRYDEGGELVETYITYPNSNATLGTRRREFSYDTEHSLLTVKTILIGLDNNEKLGQVEEFTLNGVSTCDVPTLNHLLEDYGYQTKMNVVAYRLTIINGVTGAEETCESFDYYQYDNVGFPLRMSVENPDGCLTDYASGTVLEFEYM